MNLTYRTSPAGFESMSTNAARDRWRSYAAAAIDDLYPDAESISVIPGTADQVECDDPAVNVTDLRDWLTGDVWLRWIDEGRP